MTGRERLRAILDGATPDRCGFWMGQPDPESWPALLAHFGCADRDAVRRRLGDDFTWVMAGAYRHPAGREAFESGDRARLGLGAPGPLADCETAAEVEAYDWPDPEHLDFEPALERLRGLGETYRAGGMWCCHFDQLRNLFGFEDCLVAMHTAPAAVEAAMAHIASFFLEGNRRFFEQAGDELDALFFGNDLGTQLDLLVSPEHFRRFLLPAIRGQIELAHAFGRKAILHSCGAISKILPDLVDAGLDGLHPLQAQAAGMDAASLARLAGGRLAFLGGIDTQHLLVHGTPGEVKAEVRRVRDLLGPRLVVSPSHEALLPNVPPANVAAMAEAAAEP